MLWADTETFNDVPINHGTYKYTSTCEPMLFPYAIDDGAVDIWDITTGDPMPADLEYALDDPTEPVCAANAMFDRNVLARPPISKVLPITRWRCSMVKALAHGIPGGLDIQSQIFKLGDLSKAKEGRALIHLFCKPRPKNSVIRRATRLTHPDEWEQFKNYAKLDVEAMRLVYNKLPSWNYGESELALWHLDQKINDRGLYVDVPFAQAAIAAVERAQKILKKRTQESTNYDGLGTGVESTSKRDELLYHILKEYGVDLPDLQKDTLERRVNDPDLPRELRDLLGIRLAASSTSTSKYTALVRGVQPDARLRGTLQFNGAARTRRPAGRTFQPTNLPRPDMPHDAIEAGIEAINANCEDLLYDDVMRLTRNTIRGSIIAPPHKKLVVADLSNIEGRLAAWFGGEQWKLDAFRANDTFVLDAQGQPIPDGKGDFLRAGPDLYRVAYASAFGIDVDDVDSFMRQIGKVLELMLAYEGGVGAFVTGAATYRIDLDQLTRTVIDTIPEDVLTEARNLYEFMVKKGRSTFGLPVNTYLVCDSLKRLWRRRHPGIVSLWKEMKETAIQAICNPGTTFDCRKFKMRRDGTWFRILLPSGNYLCYPSIDYANDKISYMGMNQYTRKWSRIYTYGGKFLENADQSMAGDVLRINWPDIEDYGYGIVLTVYDENVTEAPQSPEFNAEHLSSLMVREHDCIKGLPLAAKGYEAQRYRKD